MKLTYLTIILVLVFLLYVIRACDPATQSSAVENATCRTALTESKANNTRMEVAWQKDINSLVNCWQRNGYTENDYKKDVDNK